MEQQEAISTVIAEHFEQQVDFLERLVRTKSDNPFRPNSSSPDVPVEKEMATVIAQELQSLGFPVSTSWHFTSTTKCALFPSQDRVKTRKHS